MKCKTCAQYQKQIAQLTKENKDLKVKLITALETADVLRDEMVKAFDRCKRFEKLWLESLPRKGS